MVKESNNCSIREMEQGKVTGEVSTGTKTEAEMKCPICKSLAISRCGGCNKVVYCSRDHQKEHWKSHKGECQAWKISQSLHLGRYLTTVRDIKAGEIIFQERPLLITPPKITPPICPGCYVELCEIQDDGPGSSIEKKHPKYVYGEKSHPCPGECGWPTCGDPVCSTGEHEPECLAGKLRGGIAIRNFGADHPTYQAIGVLRFLAQKEKNFVAYEKLMSLQSYLPNLENANELMNPEQDDDEKSRNMVIVSLLQEFFKLKEISEDEILKISRIIEINGHEIPISDPDGQITRSLIGVYHIASFLEHNCRPNCVKTWEPSNKEIIIRASVGIKKGENLSISYVDPIWGTNDRIHLLQMTKSFTCKCVRCCDPTELGTHISSIRCQHIRCSNKIAENPNVGLIIPQYPFNPETDWKCNTCEEIYSPTYISSIIGKVGREIETLQQKRGDIEAEEEFLKKFYKILSPNHFYALEVQVELAQIYGRTENEPLPILSPQKLLRKRQLCEQLLRVFNVILPGYNRLRALILYELQAATSTLSKLRRMVGDISPQTHREELQACVKWMNEVIKVLSWEPPNSIEHRRALGGKMELEDLKELLNSTEENTKSN